MKTKEEINEIMRQLPFVCQMTTNKGLKVKNQFILEGECPNGDVWELFQSYKSPIALKIAGKVYIFHDWDYSNTTGKYRNQFLNENKAETLKKLKSGECISVDFEVRVWELKI